MARSRVLRRVAVMALAMVVFPASPCWACSCAAPPDDYDRTVANAKSLYVGVWESTARGGESGDQIVFRVTRVLSGEARSTITVPAEIESMSSCSIREEIGQRWILPEMDGSFPRGSGCSAYTMSDPDFIERVLKHHDSEPTEAPSTTVAPSSIPSSTPSPETTPTPEPTETPEPLQTESTGSSNSLAWILPLATVVVGGGLLLLRRRSA